MRQTLSKLESRFDGMPAGAAERLAKRVAHGQGLGRRTGTDGRRQALLRLGQAKRLFTAKATAGIELGHLIDGLGNTYRKARKAFRQAYREPSDESFHVWRKRVQQHWRHMALLSRGWPEAMGARASEAKELSRLLGEDHDHSILLTFARERGASILEPQDIDALTALCRSCQAELRAAARPRGERLLAEPTRNLEERVALYWTSAQGLAALAPAKDARAAKQAPSDRVKSARYRKR
jgi:hypothetical protein